MFRHQRSYYQPVRRRSPVWRRAAPRGRGAYAPDNAMDLNQRMVKNIVLAVFFISALGWLVYFFFLSDNWAIKKIQITGLASIPEPEFLGLVKEEIGRKKLFILPNDNILLFSKSALMARLNKKYVVEELKINKELPFTLNIDVKEKQARLVLKAVSKMEVKNEVPESESTTATSTAEAIVATTIVTATNYFYLDVNGIVVGEYAPPETLDANAPVLPMVEIEYFSQTLVKPGDVILKSEEIGYIFALYDALARSSANVKLETVIYNPRLGDELKFVTTEGWQGLVSKKLPLETQIRKLEQVLSEKIRDKRRILKYVDLRVKDRVYFK